MNDNNKTEFTPTNYKAMMEKNKKSFPEIYEQAMENYNQLFNIWPVLKEKLVQKRQFGLKKYGEIAFQSNFDNAMSAPAAIHLEEEIIDAFNYILHIHFQLSVLGGTTEQKDAVELIVRRLKEVYTALHDDLLP